MMAAVKTYRWQCIECKCCNICGTSENDVRVPAPHAWLRPPAALVRELPVRGRQDPPRRPSENFGSLAWQVLLERQLCVRCRSRHRGHKAHEATPFMGSVPSWEQAARKEMSDPSATGREGSGSGGVAESLGHACRWSEPASPRR